MPPARPSRTGLAGQPELAGAPGGNLSRAESGSFHHASFSIRVPMDRAEQQRLENATMVFLAGGPPLSLTTIGEGETGPVPPGAARVEALFVTVGIAIFLALLVGAIVILVRRHRRQ